GCGIEADAGQTTEEILSLACPCVLPGAFLLLWSFQHFLTSTNRSAENIGIKAIVVAELKLRNVQRHIFRRHLVERCDPAALQDRRHNHTGRLSCLRAAAV